MVTWELFQVPHATTVVVLYAQRSACSDSRYILGPRAQDTRMRLPTCAIVIFRILMLGKLDTNQLFDSPDLIADGAMNALTAWTHNAAHTTFIFAVLFDVKEMCCVGSSRLE